MIRSSATRRTVETGTAKPMPMFPPLVVKIEVLMPMISPEVFSSGPPELPGLIAASVWITLSIRSPDSDRMVRPSELMIPVVSVF